MWHPLYGKELIMSELKIEPSTGFYNFKAAKAAKIPNPIINGTPTKEPDSKFYELKAQKTEEKNNPQSNEPFLSYTEETYMRQHLNIHDENQIIAACAPENPAKTKKPSIKNPDPVNKHFKPTKTPLERSRYYTNDIDLPIETKNFNSLDKLTDIGKSKISLELLSAAKETFINMTKPETFDCYKFIAGIGQTLKEKASTYLIPQTKIPDSKIPTKKDLLTKQNSPLKPGTVIRLKNASPSGSGSDHWGIAIEPDKIAHLYYSKNEKTKENNNHVVVVSSPADFFRNVFSDKSIRLYSPLPPTSENIVVAFNQNNN